MQNYLASIICLWVSYFKGNTSQQCVLTTYSGDHEMNHTFIVLFIRRYNKESPDSIALRDLEFIAMYV